MPKARSKYWMGALAGALLLSGWLLLPAEPLVLQTQHTAAGWGYLIKQKSRIIIDQPTIPAVQGVQGFSSKQNAQRVGELVVSKIYAGHFPPSLTLRELDSLGVLP
jgi:hypothetical protein